LTGVDTPCEGAILGVDVRRFIVTKGDFVAYSCVRSNRAAVWGGEWGGPRHWCLRWRSISPNGKKRFWGFFSFIGLNGVFELHVFATKNYTGVVREKLTIFS